MDARQHSTFPGEYKTFASDVRTLQNNVQDLEDVLATNSVSSALENDLNQNITACEAVLQELSDLVDKFNDLPLQSQRTWDRLNWGQDDETGLRARLQKSSEQLASFYQKLRESPTAQIDRALQLLAKEVSNGRHETSTATSLSTTAVDPDDDSGWDQIIRDLGDLGVEEKSVTDHKKYITDWILRAINDGILTDEKIPVEPDTLAVPQSPPPRPPKTPIQEHRLPAQRYPPHYNSPPPDYSQKQLYVQPPERRPSVSPPYLRPVVSTDGLNQVSTGMSSINMDEPPSPISEPAESNILWNAQKIAYNWNNRDWQRARTSLEDQIACVQRGEVVEISDFPQQPDERILKHLLGVLHSFSGDFMKARETFEDVLSSGNLNALALDDGAIAAARWLGETCIMMNQVLNASLAWAIAYYGLVTKHPPHIPGNKEHQHMLDDLRQLNTSTHGLNILKNSFTNSNRDVSTILKGSMADTTKFTCINTALEAFIQYPQVHFVSRHLPQNLTLAEGFLVQPLVSQKSWPFPQDPFFQPKRATDLLSALSRPRSAFQAAAIQSTSLRNTKSLVFVTKNSVEWLAEAIRYALNTYAVEWKIQFSEYLLRLSGTHDRIAYYDVFIVKFRKLPFRSMYGFKVVDSPHLTRQFTAKWLPTSHETTHMDEIFRKNKIRAELSERLKDYVKQAEIDLARGEWPPREIDNPNARGPLEIDSHHVPHQEMGDQRANAWEMPGQGVVRRKPVHEPMSYEMIAELPG